MENITLGQVAAALGFLVAFFGGIAYFVKPVRTFEERIQKIEKNQDNDNKRLKTLESDTKQILLSVNALLNHSIDNNHIDKLKQRKNELDNYLIER